MIVGVFEKPGAARASCFVVIVLYSQHTLPPTPCFSSLHWFLSFFLPPPFAFLLSPHSPFFFFLLTPCFSSPPRFSAFLRLRHSISLVHHLPNQATLKKPAHNWWTKITRESAGASERLRREDYKIYLYKKNELHTSATDGRQQLFLSGSLHMYAVSHSLVNASWNVSAKAAASASWRTKLKT